MSTFRTNLTFCKLFKELLDIGDYNVRIAISPKGDGYSVYNTMINALKKSILPHHDILDKLELRFIISGHENLVSKITFENFIVEKGALLKDLMKNMVAVRITATKGDSTFKWVIVSGAAHNLAENKKKYIDYECYAEIFDKIFVCKPTLNLKCSLNDETLSREEKFERFRKLVTDGILNQQLTYFDVKITYVADMSSKKMFTTRYHSVTNSELKDKIYSLYKKEKICFMYLSLVTTRKNLLEWAIYFDKEEEEKND